MSKLEYPDETFTEKDPRIGGNARKTDKAALKQAREDLLKLYECKPCQPIAVRLAWHDSGTYNKVNTQSAVLVVRSYAGLHFGLLRRCACPDSILLVWSSLAG